MNGLKELARQAGFTPYGQRRLTAELEAFAKLVAAKEREACAKVCEEQYEYYGYDHVFAKAIRARK
jgi:hypothetical protein